VLDELSAADKPMVYALNKADRVPDLGELETAVAELPNAVLTSATTGRGVDDLRDLISDSLEQPLASVTLQVPYSHLNLLNLPPQEGRVLSYDYQPEGVVAEAELTWAALGRLKRYVVAEP
jgi:GTP-binding protein HflX